MTIIKSEFSLALNQVATERGISPDDVIFSIEQAIIAAYKKEYSKEEEEIKVVVNKDTGGARIFKDDKDITPPGFGRIAAQTAKQVILQKIREAEKKPLLRIICLKLGHSLKAALLDMMATVLLLISARLRQFFQRRTNEQL